MATEKKYPKTSDSYNPSEISVVDGVNSTNLPTQAWSRSGLILRFLDSPYTDYSPKGLSATVGEGVVTATEGVATFNGSAALYAPTSLQMFGASPSYFIGYAEFNQDVSATGDQTVFHITGNGAKSRLLLSGGYIYIQVFFNDGSSDYIRYTYAKGVSYKVSYKIKNNGDGTITYAAWSNGALVQSKTVTKTPYTSALSNSIGSEPNLIQNFLGTMGSVSFYGDELTDAECLSLTIDGPLKYPKAAILDMAQDVTDPQLTKYVSFSYEKNGAGSLLFRVSDDEGVNWDAWDGVSWSPAGSGYNSATTLNDYLEQYDAATQKLRVRVAHISDGWQQVGMDYVQIGYNLNSQPNIIAGPASIVTKGSIVSPALGAFFSDVDDNITRCFYQFAGGAEVEVFQGIYATLLEALQAISFDSSSWDIGTKSITYIVEDALGARGQDTTEIFVVANDSQVISDTYSLLQTIKTQTDNIVSIKTETDKIVDIKTETDKIPLVKTETDKIPSIKTETDKIPEVKSETDLLSGIVSGVESLLLRLGLIEPEVEKIQSIKNETDKIQTVINSQSNDSILIDQIHSRFYGTRIIYNQSLSEYSVFDKSDVLLAKFKTFDENMNPSGVRVINVVKQ